MEQLKSPRCGYFLQLNSSLEVFLRTPKNSSYFENPWYVGWKVCQKTINDKFAQLVGRPNFFHENASIFTLPHVYMGTPGPGVFEFHVDLHVSPSWQIQLTGRKIWRVHPPPECWNTCSKNIIEILLEPGDALFVQSGYWYHATEVLGTNLSELSQVFIFDYESGLLSDLI
ncbi:uncharacterized protein LOC111717191 [Eurytemora carolleeae]|uniref:uncharacterized protein LOC111717191 n=1 Tax=Eurytemora carolleeae TaxID=1294199 RepID=UPI000C76ED82|nr:uncharacterized protein LOC111717191 [Eurytemora carolleeae]|eukprot:XP_023348464.1 uncharacterized protein LOC111717191 [Eurytemora affinis]